MDVISNGSEHIGNVSSFPIPKNLKDLKKENPKYAQIENGIYKKGKTIIKNGDEPDWKLSEQIYKEVYAEMPSDLSLEEKAIFIYCKLCKIFLYDEGYFYRDKIDKINYSFTFSKEHLESLEPGAKITCFDFARIYSKLINELDGNIACVVVKEGRGRGHASCEFFTDNVTVGIDAVLDGISIFDDTNDLTKAKAGMKLEGINIVSDDDNIIGKAIDKVYPMALGKHPKTIRDFIKEFSNKTQEKLEEHEEQVPNDIDSKLKILLDLMKEKNISGDEFSQTFCSICRTTYFGKDILKVAFVGKR